MKFKFHFVCVNIVLLEHHKLRDAMKNASDFALIIFIQQNEEFSVQWSFLISFALIDNAGI